MISFFFWNHLLIYRIHYYLLCTNVIFFRLCVIDDVIIKYVRVLPNFAMCMCSNVVQ